MQPEWRLTEPTAAYAILGDATNIEAGIGVKETVEQSTRVYSATFNGDHYAPLPEPETGAKGVPVDAEEVVFREKWKVKHEAAREQEQIYSRLMQLPCKLRDGVTVPTAEAHAGLRALEGFLETHVVHVREQAKAMQRYAGSLGGKTLAPVGRVTQVTADKMTKQLRKISHAHAAVAHASADVAAYTAAREALTSLQLNTVGSVEWLGDMRRVVALCWEAVKRFFRVPPPKRDRHAGEPYRIRAHEIYMMRVQEIVGGLTSVVAGLFPVAKLSLDDTEEVIRATFPCTDICAESADGAEASLRDRVRPGAKPETRKALAIAAKQKTFSFVKSLGAHKKTVGVTWKNQKEYIIDEWMKVIPLDSSSSLTVFMPAEAWEAAPTGQIYPEVQHCGAVEDSYTDGLTMQSVSFAEIDAAFPVPATRLAPIEEADKGDFPLKNYHPEDGKAFRHDDSDHMMKCTGTTGERSHKHSPTTTNNQYI